MAVGMAGWTCGTAIWAWDPNLHTTELPSWMVAGIGGHFILPLMAVPALLFLFGGSPRNMLIGARHAWVIAILDLLVIAGSLFVVSWSLVLRDIAQSSTATASVLSVAMVYPLSDLVMASLALTMFTFIPARRGEVARQILLAAGFLLLTVSDSFRSHFLVHDTPMPYWAHVGFILGPACFAAAAVYATNNDSAPPPATHSARWRLLIPHLTLFVSFAIGFATTGGGTDSDPITRDIAVAVVLILMIRQFIGLSESTALVQQLSVATRLFQVSIYNAPFGEIVINTAGKVLHANSALRDMFGITTDQLHTMNQSQRLELAHPDDKEAVDKEWSELMSGAVERTISEHRYKRPDGTVIWAHRIAQRVASTPTSGEDLIIAQYKDITAEKTIQTDLARLADTDALTGLFNRHALMRSLTTICRTTESAETASVIFIDLDDFKAVNDTYGHAVGDALLVAVGQRLRTTLPEHDIYRIGGDEFVAVATTTTPEQDSLTKQRDTVCMALATPYFLARVTVHITASAGVARGGQGESPDSILSRADQEMYRDKRPTRRTNRS